MGLDMYLNAKRFLWTSSDGEDTKIANAVAALMPELTPKTRWGEDQSRIKEIIIEAVYWRKANAIHQWFVNNVQEGTDDCVNYYVSREKLQELAALCEQILADKSLAKALLPTASGFFFGDTSYDDYYFDDIQRTKEEIEAALKLPDNWDFEYQSSW
jgi:hypothetical protein